MQNSCFILTDEQSAKIANLSLVCACLVVCLHIVPTADKGSLLWVAHSVLADGIGRIAVPFFFLVSGMMLAKHCGDDNWWTKAIRKRLFSLGVPFLIWNLIYAYGIVMLSNVLSGRGWMEGVRWDPVLIGIDVFRQPVLGPTWYIRTLLVFVLISPLLVWLVREFGKKFVVALFVIALLFYIPDYSFYGSWKSVQMSIFSLEGLSYFGLGLYFGVYGLPRMKLRLRYIGWFAGISCILLLFRIVAKMQGWMFLYYHLRELIIPGFLLAAYYFIPSLKWPKELVRLAFPIFLIHPLVIFAVQLKYPSPLCGLWYFISLIACICFSAVIPLIVNLTLPKLSGILWGGR